MAPRSSARASSTEAETHELIEIRDAHRQHPSIDLLQGLFGDETTGWHTFAPYVALVLQLLVICFLVSIIPITILVDFKSNAYRLVYTTGVAVVASIISSFVLAQIRMLWLQDLAYGTQNAAQRLHKAQILLLVSPLRHQAKYYGVTSSLIVFGLMTTSIIGATTATTASRVNQHWSSMYVGGPLINPFSGIWPPQSSKSFMSDDGCWSTNATHSHLLGQFGWTLQDGSFFGISPLTEDSILAGCPGVLTLQTLDYWSTTYSQGYYPNNGQCISTSRGAVACNALGAPISSGSCDLLQTFGCDFPTTTDLSITACLPVFTSSPVSCRPIDASFQPDHSFASIGPNSCQMTGPESKDPTRMGWLYTDDDTGLDDRIFIGVCTTNRSIGDATILIASESFIADLVAPSMLEYTIPTYTGAECNISLTADKLAFQKVTLSRNVLLPDGKGIPVYFINGTGQKCDPTPAQASLNTTLTGGQPFEVLSKVLQVLNDKTLAAATFSLFYHLNHSFQDAMIYAGDVQISWQQNQYNGSSPPKLQDLIAFPDSNNALEDYLGVTYVQSTDRHDSSLIRHRLAAYLSHYFGYLDVNPQVEDRTTSTQMPVYRVEVGTATSRVGSGSRWALIYIVTAVASVVTLLKLIWAQRWSSRSGPRLVV